MGLSTFSTLISCMPEYCLPIVNAAPAAAFYLPDCTCGSASYSLLFVLMCSSGLACNGVAPLRYFFSSSFAFRTSGSTTYLNASMVAYLILGSWIELFRFLNIDCFRFFSSLSGIIMTDFLDSLTCNVLLEPSFEKPRGGTSPMYRSVSTNSALFSFVNYFDSLNMPAMREPLWTAANCLSASLALASRVLMDLKRELKSAIDI